MTILRNATILVTALLLSGCNPLKNTAEAEKAVAEFHSRFDAEDFETIYATAHADFKAAQTKPKLIEFIRSVRDKLGKVKTAKRNGWQAKSHNLKTYVILTYSTEFEHGSGVEKFTYRIVDGRAVLLGWNINSRDLIVPVSKGKQNATDRTDTAPDSKPAGDGKPVPDSE